MNSNCFTSLDAKMPLYLGMFFVLCCLPCCGASEKIPELIFDKIGKFQPREKGDVTLSCRTSNDKNEVQYRRDGTLLTRFTDNRLIVKNRMLTIPDLNYTTDDGLYQCVEKSNRGVLLSLKKALKVSVLGTFAPGFRISDAVITLDVVIGRPFVLQCPSVTYTNPNNVLWGNVQENQVLLRSTRRRYILSNGDFLFTYIDRGDVNEINQQMGGVSCIYYHIGFFVQSVRYQLKIVADLKTDVVPSLRERIASKTEVKEGDEYSFYCSATGKPVPDIKWHGPDGKEITSQTRDYVISATRHKLTVKVAYARLAGRYRCEVSSSAGSISSEGQLIVQVPPSWSKRLNNRVVQANTDVTLNVEAKGNGILNYKWFKNGNPIDFSNASYAVSGKSLTIKNIQPNDYGYFQCFASNSIHEITTAAFINVEGSVVPPTTTDTKETNSRVYFEYYILIGAAGLMIIGIVLFIVYLHKK